MEKELKLKHRIGCWCISTVHQSQYDPDHKQYILISNDPFHIKVGCKKYYFVKNSRVNEFILCQAWRQHASADDECGNGDRCSVCLQDFVHKDNLIKLDCTHTFHQKCLLTWLRQKKRCPLCQNDVPSTKFGRRKEKLQIPEKYQFGHDSSFNSMFFSTGYSTYLF